MNLREQKMADPPLPTAESSSVSQEECYRGLFEHNHSVMLVIDPEDGRIVDANPAAATYYGWTREELRQKSIGDINTLPSTELRAQIKAIRQGGGPPFLFQHRLADGRVRDVEVSSGPILLNGRPHLFSIVHDVTERQRREEILQSRLFLREVALRHSLEELLRKTLDEAERLTGSRIGFFHFVAEDQTTLLPQVWSTNTLQGICTSVPEGHYPIDQAGVWVDCIRQRRAVIHNDYASLPHRKGLPEGHAPVLRELVVPVMRGERIVAVLGVGNKPRDYGSEDVGTISLLADLAWDITERKRSKKALKELLLKTRASEERLSVTLQSVTDGLVALDGEGRITLINPAAERLLHTTAGEAGGEHARNVIHDAKLLSRCLNLLTNEAGTDTLEMAMFDGQRQENRMIQVRLAALPKTEGKRGGVIATFFDVTRDREVERMKSEFVMTAAHELRTPLTAILGYAELLEEGAKTGLFTGSQRLEFISQILEKGDVLIQIIDDLLDLGRIEGGRPLLLEKSVCEVARLIEGAIDHYRRETRRHCFKMKLTPPDLQVAVDKTRISQVLDNLLTNAIKYSPAGGTILVEGQAVADEIRISVTDEGIGMTREQAERVFEKFYRADASTTAVRGLGLGLCVAKGIVEAHGGQIWVNSAPRQGTTVVFTLPHDIPSA